MNSEEKLNLTKKYIHSLENFNPIINSINEAMKEQEYEVANGLLQLMNEERVSRGLDVVSIKEIVSKEDA